MKNKYYTGLVTSALLSFLLLSTHTATAGHGKQGAGDTSTLNIGITFVTPAWSSPKHRTVVRPVHYIRDRHGHPVVSSRFQTYEKHHKHGRHVCKAHWRKKQHHNQRAHRNHRSHSYYR